jgi:hypothetical protein
MSWERSNVDMRITRSAFSNGWCKRISAPFAKLLPSLRCVALTNNYAYDWPLSYGLNPSHLRRGIASSQCSCER